MPLTLRLINKTDPQLLEEARRHYSQPGGFPGRVVAYAVELDGIRYGSTIGGSATMWLKGRDEFFGFAGLKGNDPSRISAVNRIVNNTFFHIEPGENGYPMRNFATAVVKA